MLEKFELSGGRLPAMEGLRGYAAFIVFFVHGVILTQPTIGNGWIPAYLKASQHGVDVFFLLSGFLITGMALKGSFQYREFLAHRIVRIYPAFLASLVAYGLFHAVARGEHIGLGRWIANLLLLNGAYPLGIEPINSVTWSLFFEFAFYLSFPLLMMTSGTPKKRLLIATLAGLPIIAGLAVLDHRFARFAMFLAGAWLRVVPMPKISDQVVIVGYLAATTSFLFFSNWPAFLSLYIVPATLLVNQSLYGSGVLNRFFSLRAVRLFGNISYSFYLWHPAGIVAARYAVAPMRLSGVAWVVVVFVVGFAIATAMAAASFLLLERPYFQHYVPINGQAAAR